MTICLLEKHYGVKYTRLKSDLILNPFNGSGTTCAAAKRLQRHWLGIDTNEEYCNLAIDRVQNNRNGDLKKKDTKDELIEYPGSMRLCERKHEGILSEED